MYGLNSLPSAPKSDVSRGKELGKQVCPCFHHGVNFRQMVQVAGMCLCQQIAIPGIAASIPRVPGCEIRGCLNPLLSISDEGGNLFVGGIFD
ncbi:hypothetical protein [Thalassospira lucentensis]|uniref:hypothetical protein n=1 Tax=Thalassospira lucentensis TaxID=168935 RepID=UPI0029438BB3|nr:hypothetical protein [Thalassospira lucentensis]WOI08981.1 hypothetical protein R1T41_00710 [Thalassospira lucentensis]